MDGRENDSFYITPLKRKRGRPRKDQNCAGEYPDASSGERFASTVPCHVEPGPSAELANVGEPIGGVIEAVFDAGYLLNVKLSSGTTLRGVVFKPGHYIPFSDENDVAPNAQLVKRNDVPIPSGTQIQTRGTKRRRGWRNANGVPHGAPVDHLPVIAANPISSSGKFVPVVLSPTFSLPNGILPPSPAPHMVSPISNIFSPFSLEGPSLFSGFSPGHFNQILPYQHQQSLHAGAVRPGKLSHVPFQHLLDEVIRRTESRSDLEEEPLSAEPLQSIQPNFTKDARVIKLYQESLSNGTQSLPQNGISSSYQNDKAEVGSKD